MKFNEQKLKEAAYYGGDAQLIPVDIRSIVDIESLKPLGRGLNTRVFKIPGTDWVVKEGRWDMDANLFKNVSLKLPAETAETILKKFELYFLPNEEEIKRQYRLYMEMVEYYGYFKDKDAYHHPEIALIFQKQDALRKKMIDFIPDLCHSFKLAKYESQLATILDKDALKTNFLPKEYLLFGESFSPENKGRQTYYLFQKFIKGKTLHDVSLNEIPRKNRSRVVLLAYILLLMSITAELVPDLRPRYFLTEAHDWFLKTDNIILSNGDVKFIDTRWMWNMNDNFIKRGVIIPELTVESTRQFLIKCFK